MDFICGTVKKDGWLYGGFDPEKISIKFNIIPSSVVGFFIRRSSLRKVGYLNIKYKIQADYDLLCPPKNSSLFSKGLPNVKIIQAYGAGHYISDPGIKELMKKEIDVLQHL